MLLTDKKTSGRAIYVKSRISKAIGIAVNVETRLYDDAKRKGKGKEVKAEKEYDPMVDGDMFEGPGPDDGPTAAAVVRSIQKHCKILQHTDMKMERPSAAYKRATEAEAAAAAETLPATTEVIEEATIARRRDRIRFNAARKQLNPKAVAAPKKRVLGTPETERCMSSTTVFTVRTDVVVKRNDPTIQAMCGDYAECGEHHDRKMYIRKTFTRDGHMTYIYYYDLRDGVDYCGWWFGPSDIDNPLARCAMMSETPPSEGWKVPWDSASKIPGLIVIDWGDQ